MSRPRSNWPRFFAILLVLALPVLMLAWLMIPGARPQDALARRWQAELSTLPFDELPRQMRKIADLGDAGLPVLAQSLHAEREEVADAALAALEIEVARWRTLEKSEASRRAAVLARELAQRGTMSDTSRRRMAADVATKLLLLPLDRLGTDRVQMLADCETVLRAAATPAPASFSGVLPRVVDGTQWQHSGVIEAAASGADESSPNDLATTPPADVRMVSTVPRVPAESSATDGPRAAKSSYYQRAPENAPPAALEPLRARPLAPRAKLTELDELALMRLLHSPGEGNETAAEKELMRRGYTAFRLRLARRLTDPDPKVRRELAEMLPQMSGLDARPWLLWLSHDEDDSVRRAAASILATSTDPKLLARLREMRSLERDSETRRE